MIRNRTIPESRTTRPQIDAESSLELRDGDDVAEAPPGEEGLDRGPVQLGPLAHDDERMPVERCGDVAGELVGDTDLGRGVGHQLPVEEPGGRIGEELDGWAGRSPASRHHTNPSDTPQREHRPNARSAQVIACREEPAVGEVEVASERDRVIGQRVHALIGGYLRAGLVPAPRQIWVAAAKVFAAAPLPQNHAARQRAACATAAYFSIFRPAGWTFLGSEVDLGTGRVDLVWETPEGRVIIDEVKMAGSGDQVDDPATVAQVRRYCTAAAESFGERFAGVRLLPLAAPGRALWCTPDGGRVRLSEAEVA